MFTHLIFEATRKLAAVLRAHPRVRLVTFVVTILIGLGSGALVFLSQSRTLTHVEAGYVWSGAGFALLLGTTLSYSLLASLVSERDIRKRSTVDQLDDLEAKREKINNRLVEAPAKIPNVVDSIMLAQIQLTEYYTINKAQAKVSYRFSLLLIIMGAVFLGYSAWTLLGSTNHDVMVPVLTAIAGVVMEFLGGTSFFVFRFCLLQSNLYFGQLVKMQDTMLAITLCDQIEPSDKRAIVKERIIEVLLSRPSPAHVHSSSVAGNADGA